MKIFVVFKVAKDVDGTFAQVRIETAFKTKEQADQYFVGKPVIWEEIFQGMEIESERSVNLVSLNGETIYTIFRVDKEITTEFVFLATEFATSDRAEALSYIKETHWKETINNIECECQRDFFEIELI